MDKVLHIAVSFVLCAVLSLLLPLWGAMLITFMIGVAKELIWDLWMKNGCADWEDIIADLLGISIFYMSSLVFKLLCFCAF